MARFFKYRSADDLRADAARMGLDIPLDDDLSPLFAPRRIGNFTVGNSLCVQPMEGCDGTLDGRPDELTYRRYRRFGAGGAKFIWGEAAAVCDEGRATPRQLLVADHTVADLARIVAECRAAHRQAVGDDSDLLLGLQLTHSGRYSGRRPLLAMRDPLLDPRTLDPTTKRPIDADYPTLSDDDLARLVPAYVAAAKRAQEAGFQFVDVKQCHRYLLNELLAARERPGRFGGSLENRTRLAREIIQAVRDAAPGLSICVRLSLYDGVPYRKRSAEDATGEPVPHMAPLTSTWGTDLNDASQPDLTEPLAWVGEMAKLGVACVNVSLGNPYASPHLLRPFETPPPDGYEAPEHPLIGVDRHFRITETLQRAYPDLPIVGSGYSYLQEYLGQSGAANLRRGRVAFVGVGRATLSQPDFALQLREHGKLDRKRVCRTFSTCTALMRSKHHPLGQFATGCPPFDKETYGPIWAEAQAKPKG